MQASARRRRPFGAFRSAVFVILALSYASVAYAQSNDSPPSDSQGQQEPPPKSDAKPAEAGMTKLKIRVTSDADKPVANASVYVRFYESGGFLHHDKLAEMNFKTNQDGSVKVPEIPQGKILIQVIASGWHTYGKWYDVDKDEEAITIKLVPPPHWY